MNDDAPRKCAVRGGTTLGAAANPPRLAQLALALLCTPLCASPAAAAGTATGAAVGASADDTLPGHALARGPGAAYAGLDPRGSARLTEAEPSPAGRFVALVAEGRQRETALWFVDLASGDFRPFEGGAPTGAPLAWHGERLWTEVMDERGSLARRRLVAIDPASGRYDELPRGTELEPEWASTVITRRASGKRVLTIEWAGTGRGFELPTGPNGAWTVTETAGVVFWSELEHDGAVRVLRHDLATAQTLLVAIIGGDAPHWSPSADGLVLAASDDQRLRLLDALSGEPLFGPWPAGVVTWLPGGHGHLLVASGGNRYVLDVYAGRRILLGPDTGPEPKVHRLAGGGYLVQRGDSLERIDIHGRVTAELVD